MKEPMVPPTSNPMWAKLVKGELELKSSKLALNMLLFNNRLSYAKDTSPANLQKLIAHTYEFFVKFEGTFKEELQRLSS